MIYEPSKDSPISEAILGESAAFVAEDYVNVVMKELAVHRKARTGMEQKNPQGGQVCRSEG